MANMNIRQPRFYIDYIGYLLSRGVAQNGNFDVTATGGSGASAFRGLQTGTEAELFDGRPLNLCGFDTGGDTDSQVLVTINLQSANPKQSFIAILNHNLATAGGKIRVCAGGADDDHTAVDAGNADTADVSWNNENVTEVVNADIITVASNNKSVVIQPATDGTTIFKFDEQDLRYWGIQFEGAGSGTGAATDDTWNSTDLSIGQIMLGEYFEMKAPDLAVQRSIAFDHVSVQESIGGQRFANMTSHGRTGSSTSKSPFTTSSSNRHLYGGRIAYDMNFSYLASTDVMPDEYDVKEFDDAVVEDLWNMTNGPMLPFIFSCDKDSEGDNAESEHIFARFGQNSLDMQQVALDTFNISMRIEEEF